MKDLKHFNNASNLLLEHYLNDNDNSEETDVDNIYNYDDYDISGISYSEVYNQLTQYDDSSLNSVVSMIKPGKYSSHYFESNYSDLSNNVTKDYKYFYSAGLTITNKKINQ